MRDAFLLCALFSGLSWFHSLFIPCGRWFCPSHVSFGSLLYQVWPVQGSGMYIWTWGCFSLPPSLMPSRYALNAQLVQSMLLVFTCRPFLKPAHFCPGWEPACRACLLAHLSESAITLPFLFPVCFAAWLWTSPPLLCLSSHNVSGECPSQSCMG